MTRIIDNEEIRAHVSIEDCLSALETMFEEMAADRAITGSREDVLTPVPRPPEEATTPVYHGLKSMSGSIPEFEVGAIRINSDVIHWPPHEGSRVREKVPAADGRYTGLVWLFSTNTGEPLAIFPDGVIQSYRVGATSALGAKHLSRPDSTRLALLGAGFQARAHLLALDAVLNLETVEVYSPTRSSREAFAAEMDEEVDPTVRAVDAPEPAVERADVLQCATNATEPVFDFEWVRSGTHIGIIRSDEASEEFFEPDRFDAFAQSWTELTQREELAGRVTRRTIPSKNVNNYVVEGDEPAPKFRNADGGSRCDWSRVDSLSDLVAGDVPGRTNRDGITGFLNEGMGIQFAAVGKVVFETAQEQDLGRVLPTETLTEETHP